MGRIINFPTTNSFSKENKEKRSEMSLSRINDDFFSQKNEDLIIGLLREWPCFSDLKPETSMEDLLNRYCDETLTVSQQFALDFMLHIQDPKFVFNISHALLSWGSEDREFFFLLLEKHLEVQDIMYNL